MRLKTDSFIDNLGPESRGACVFRGFLRQAGLGVDETSEMAGLASEVDAIEGFPWKHQEIEESGVEDPRRRKDKSRKTGDETDGGDAESVDDGGDGEQTLDAIENERISLPPSVPVESGDEEENYGEAEGVKNHHAVDLDSGREAGRKVFGADQRSEQYGVEEFQRIDAEEYQAEQRGVEEDGPPIAEAIAAEENVVRVPDIDEHQETDGGSGEGRRGRTEVGETPGNGERNDQEDEGDTEDDVAEDVEASDGAAA